MGVNIVGISAFFHDAAGCVMCDGKLVAAAAEERFTRRKHDPTLPVNAVAYCLREAGLTIADIDCLAFYENPAKKVSRQSWMLSHREQRATAVERAYPDPGYVEREIRDAMQYEGRLEFFDHHESHAASSFYCSGFHEAAIFTVDGVGEWATTAYGRASDGSIDLFEEVTFPHSLGLLYTAITTYLGFSANDGEYKVMGLAPYGEPKYVRECRQLIRSDPTSGAFCLDLRYFDFIRGVRMYSDLFCALFDHAPRKGDSEILQFHKDVARSAQVVLEELLVEKTAYLRKQVGVPDLCMAGGVALNCVANSRILRESGFRRLFVQPAADDSGGAIGAAALAHTQITGARPGMAPLRDVRLGPSFAREDIIRRLAATPLKYRDFTGRGDDLVGFVADRLAGGAIIGWFQGRMEFGPRALGSRSILADPRVASMRDRINALVKKREGFRPFAPAVLADRAGEHFALDVPSPFMLMTCQVRSPLSLPAVTHVDGSARVQTVGDEDSRFYRLLKAFEEKTGCPMVLNTSFNVRGEPIVCNPTDAIICFVRANLDVLVIEDFIILNEDIPAAWQAFAGKLPLSRQPQIAKDYYTLW